MLSLSSYVCGSNSATVMLGKSVLKYTMVNSSLFWAVWYSTEHVCSWVLLTSVACPVSFEFVMYCLLFNCIEF